jgi:hypothetical protein
MRSPLEREAAVVAVASSPDRLGEVLAMWICATFAPRCGPVALVRSL